jgi:hypothetical protein
VAFKTPKLSPQTSRQHYYIGHTDEKEAAPDPCAYQYALTDLDRADNDEWFPTSSAQPKTWEMANYCR